MAANIKNPRTFSDAFGIDPKKLESEGVFDPILNVDTKLFIDPLLLSESKHSEIKKEGLVRYRKHFEQLITLLKNSKSKNDKAWKTAEKLAAYPEITGTCLGYGAASTRGRAWGKVLRENFLTAASETISLGIIDPDLFLVVALLEDGIGADLISDMTTNIILNDLEKFNSRICKKYGIKTQLFSFKNGMKASFARNPLIEKEVTPIILVPTDILRELPIANCWEDIGDAAFNNADLRHRVNTNIGEIWKSSVRKDKKEDIRKEVYSSKESFQVLLESLQLAPKEPYDQTSDPSGFMAWMRVSKTFSKKYPLKLKHSAKPTIDDIHNIVTAIIEHYRDLVENKGLWKELWSGTKRRPEKSAQRIFFAIADVYCRINDLDITPEADSGSGPVDFKVSSSYKNRVLVELKLSTNSKVVTAYESQLNAYRKAESTTRASYVVIDVGSMGTKEKRLMEIRNNALKNKEPASKLEFISGLRQKSASKR